LAWRIRVNGALDPGLLAAFMEAVQTPDRERYS